MKIFLLSLLTLFSINSNAFSSLNCSKDSRNNSFEFSIGGFPSLAEGSELIFELEVKVKGTDVIKNVEMKATIIETRNLFGGDILIRVSDISNPRISSNELEFIFSAPNSLHTNNKIQIDDLVYSAWCFYRWNN